LVGLNKYIRGQRGQGGQAKKSFFKILEFFEKSRILPAPCPLIRTTNFYIVASDKF
jgi:hypothetical protein